MALQQSLRQPNWRTTEQMAVPVHTLPPRTSAADEHQAKWNAVVLVKRRKSNKCEICGTPPKTHNTLIGPLHGHHRLGRAQGGPPIIENCMLVCATCHRNIHEAGEASYAAGHMISASSPLARHLLAIAAIGAGE